MTETLSNRLTRQQARDLARLQARNVSEDPYSTEELARYVMTGKRKPGVIQQLADPKTWAAVEKKMQEIMMQPASKTLSQLGNLGASLLQSIPEDFRRAMTNMTPETMSMGTTQEQINAAGDIAKVTGDVVGGATLTNLLLKNAVPRGTVLGANTIGDRIARQLDKTVVKYSDDLPSIRKLDAPEGIKVAQTEAHLIPAGKGSPGAYVGGPSTVKSYQDLQEVRRILDDKIAMMGRDHPETIDWYDRYRQGIEQLTSNQLQAETMAKQHALFSSQRTPAQEFALATKENNAIVAGMPMQANTKIQHDKMIGGLSSGDYGLSNKTWPYSQGLNPYSVTRYTATGTNDFRWPREIGYRMKDGSPWDAALSGPQHTFVDYETALATGRARANKAGGHAMWRGEEIQAVPWIHQKATSLMEKQNKKLTGLAKDTLARAGNKNPTPDELQAAVWNEAVRDANATALELFPNRMANVTYETAIGSEVAKRGHLPQAVNMTPAQLRDLDQSKLSMMNTAPGNRDAIYSGLGVQGTGNYMRVAPSGRMQGIYTNPSGNLEMNPGRVARPLVGANAEKVAGSKTKYTGRTTLPDPDRAILEAGENLRAALLGQNSSGASMFYPGSTAGVNRSVMIPMSGMVGDDQVKALMELGKKYNLPDVVDTGRGVIFTDFSGKLAELPTKKLKAFMQDAGKTIPGLDGTPIRGNVDGVLGWLDEAWGAGKGSGEVTKIVLDKMNVTPQMRAAFNNNPYLADVAANLMKRDEALAKKWGGVSEDLQEFRRIISQGPGWIDRMEEAVQKGFLPATVAAVGLGLTVQETLQKGDDGAL